jgi:hypothetical protein
MTVTLPDGTTTRKPVRRAILNRHELPFGAEEPIVVRKPFGY